MGLEQQLLAEYIEQESAPMWHFRKANLLGLAPVQLPRDGQLAGRDIGAHLGADAAEAQVSADGQERGDDRVPKGRRGSHGSMSASRDTWLAPAEPVATPGCGGSSATASPSPGARKRFASRPSCRSYISR
jgi:hypothetical protein